MTTKLFNMCRKTGISSNKNILEISLMINFKLLCGDPDYVVSAELLEYVPENR